MTVGEEKVGYCTYKIGVNTLLFCELLQISIYMLVFLDDIVIKEKKKFKIHLFLCCDSGHYISFLQKVQSFGCD